MRGFLSGEALFVLWQIYIYFSLKGYTQKDSPKNEHFVISHHLLTLKLFQTCMHFFLLLKTKGRYFEEC